MNVLESYKTVFLLPPRTGARYTFRSLLPFGIESHGPRIHVASHSPWVPSQCKDYAVALSVRNPYTRVISCWAGWLPRVDESLHHLQDDLNEFVLKMGRSLRQQMVPIAEGYPEADYFIRQESLDEDLKKIVPEHRPNKAFRDSFRSFAWAWEGDPMWLFSDRTREMVADMYLPDFERFGYET